MAEGCTDAARLLEGYSIAFEERDLARGSGEDEGERWRRLEVLLPETVRVLPWET